MIVHVKVNIQLKFQSDMQDSWSKALEIRLRNMRRKKCSKNTGMTFNRPKVNEKKKNSVHASSVTPGKLLDDKTFQRHKLALAKEAKKGTKNRDSVKILMRETSSNRRRWIHRKILQKLYKCSLQNLYKSLRISTNLQFHFALNTFLNTFSM